MKRFSIILIVLAICSHTAVMAQQNQNNLLKDHPIVEQTNSTKTHFEVKLINGKFVKFNNLYQVDFFASRNNPREILFQIIRGPNDVKEGIIRLNSAETAVLVEDENRHAAHTPLVYRGTRLKNDESVEPEVSGTVKNQ